MSIIACKVTQNEIEIASDSITMYGSTKIDTDLTHFSKLFQINGLTVGSVGFLEETTLFIMFLKEHILKDATEESILNLMFKFSQWKADYSDSREIENSYILIYDGRAFVVERFLVQEINTYYAVGAGSDFAFATLYLENSAERSVEVACKLSIYCELPVKKFIINKEK